MDTQVIVLTAGGGDRTAAVSVAALRRYHPDATTTVVLCDPHADPTSTIPGTTTLRARDLQVGALRYIDVHLAAGPAFARWAVVPAAVRHVRGQGGEGPTLVLGAEWWTRDDLSGLVAAAGADTIALPVRRAGSGVSWGGWLDGAVVVGTGADHLLDWWEARAVELVRTPVLDTDLDAVWQRFVDAGPSVVAVTDPAYRLAPETADEVHPGTTEVRLARFPGFDPDLPWWYAPSDDDDPLHLVSESPELRHLCAAYADELLAAGEAQEQPEVVGIRLNAPLREAVRRILATGEEPANPYDPAGAEAFLAWLREPGDRRGTGVNRAADFVWASRPDLEAAFPHVRWSDRDRFVRWLWTHGLSEGLLTTAVLPPLPAVPAAADPAAEPPVPAFGVNLIGYHDADLGLGVAVRGVGAALDAARIPWTAVTYDRTNSRTGATATRSADATEAPYWFNLLLIAPDQLQFFVDDVGADFLAGHHNIALWYWETDALNNRQRAAFDLVDEVWGATQYLTDVFAAHTDKPVVHLPVPLEFPEPPRGPAARERLGLDDRFTFVFSFDFLSIAQRKNPLELVAAYRDAFGPDDGCRLILKSINGHLHVRDAEQLRASFADRPDIELWDRYLDGDDRLALVAEADCYVSLHRSEGLGLTMAEAMAAGTPVIATGYSGNLDFTTDDSALLVRFEEVLIGEGSFYPADGHWAQPDLAHAAELMRSVRDDADLRRRLAEAGPEALRPFTTRRVGAAIADRLDALARAAGLP